MYYGHARFVSSVSAVASMVAAVGGVRTTGTRVTAGIRRAADARRAVFGGTSRTAGVDTRGTARGSTRRAAFGGARCSVRRGCRLAFFPIVRSLQIHLKRHRGHIQQGGNITVVDFVEVRYASDVMEGAAKNIAENVLMDVLEESFRILTCPLLSSDHLLFVFLKLQFSHVSIENTYMQVAPREVTAGDQVHRHVESRFDVVLTSVFLMKVQAKRHEYARALEVDRFSRPAE